MFDDAALKKVISEAFAQPDFVPAGKKLAIVTAAHPDGSVQAVVATRIGTHWQIAGTVEWHGGTIDAGIKAQASW